MFNFSFLIFILIHLFFLIKSYDFYLSMFIEEADDCISRIYNTNNDTLFSEDCTDASNFKKSYTDPVINNINYVFGEEIYIDIFDKGDVGCLKINVRINEYLIKPELKKFWTCTNCNGDDNNYIYNEDFKRFDFYNPETDGVQNTEQTFTFIFKINSRDDFIGLEGVVDGNYYTIKQTKEEYIYLNDLNDEIEVIDFKNKDNFYITYNKNLNIQFDSVYFRLYHDQRFLMTGEIYGYSFWYNNYMELSDDGHAIQVTNDYSKITYKLTEQEKNIKGTHIKLYFRAYNSPDQDNLRTEASVLSLFNYYVCLDGYKPCDVDSSLKCLKDEGYFTYNDNGVDRFYSCYERCGNCNTYKKHPL